MTFISDSCPRCGQLGGRNVTHACMTAGRVPGTAPVWGTDDSTTETAKPSNQELAAIRNDAEIELGLKLDDCLLSREAYHEGVLALVARVEALLAERDASFQERCEFRLRAAVLEAALREAMDLIDGEPRHTGAEEPCPTCDAIVAFGAVLAGGDAAPRRDSWPGEAQEVQLARLNPNNEGEDAAAEEKPQRKDTA